MDDRGENGIDVVRNIKRMYKPGDGHVQVLAASIRHVDHLLAAFALGVELVTVPTKVLEDWAARGFPLPQPGFGYKGVDGKGKGLRPIPYKELDLSCSWDRFDIRQELTTEGIEKFVADYSSTLKLTA